MIGIPSFSSSVSSILTCHFSRGAFSDRDVIGVEYSLDRTLLPVIGFTLCAVG
jgi:hypothetical protein